MEWRRGLALAGILAAGALIVGLQWRADRAKRQAVLALPAAERAALVERTLRNMETLCRDEALTTQCEAEARLLEMLPECDGACRARVERYLPEATR